jgi:hypothetical protein
LVVVAGVLRHVHVGVADANGIVSGKDGGMLWHDLQVAKTTSRQSELNLVPQGHGSCPTHLADAPDWDLLIEARNVQGRPSLILAAPHEVVNGEASLMCGGGEIRCTLSLSAPAERVEHFLFRFTSHLLFCD